MDALSDVDQAPLPTGGIPIPLAQLKVGDNGVVRHINGNDDCIIRLMEMGLIPGTIVRVNRVAPLGDPLQLTLRAYNLSMRGYDLSIRRSEARRIEVDRLP